MKTTLTQPVPNPMRAVLGSRDFILLWIGQATSMLGDQIHAITGAWLVLKLTGDPLALGTVMAGYYPSQPVSERAITSVMRLR